MCLQHAALDAVALRVHRQRGLLRKPRAAQQALVRPLLCVHTAVADELADAWKFLVALNATMRLQRTFVSGDERVPYEDCGCALRAVDDNRRHAEQ